MRLKRNDSQLSGVLALLVFSVFAVCVLGVLLTGADAYQRLNDRDQAAYNSRTCMQYLATKVRQAAGADCVSVGRFGNGDALLLTQETDGGRYLTRIYCWDGWLMELFSSPAEEFAPQDGERVLELDSLELDLTDGLLTLRAGLAGGAEELTMSLRGGGGEAG